MKNELYPLKFDPIYKEKIWGGSRIKDVLGKECTVKNCGESWEISGVKNNISVVSNGHLKGRSLVEIIEEYKSELVGSKISDYYGTEFPLLIKFLDANDELSIQVHPDDAHAKKHDSLGKTEMWYIVEAEKDASLIKGFNRDLSKDELLQRMQDGKLEEVLKRIKAAPDDVFFIPAGQIHNIGKGILLAEIQQSSDITFRLYDFERIDSDGNARPLHIKEAAEVIDYKKDPEGKITKPVVKNKSDNLVSSTYFTTNRLSFDNQIPKNYSDLDSFVIYICIAGKAKILYNDKQESISKGEVVLLPSSIKEISLQPEEECKLLESYIE